MIYNGPNEEMICRITFEVRRTQAVTEKRSIWEKEQKLERGYQMTSNKNMQENKF